MWIAPLFIKRPEIAKTTALAAQNGIFNDKVEIITEVKEDLVWWTKNVSDFSSPVVREKKRNILTIKTVASGTGCGGECDGQTTGGMWTAD